MRKAAGWGLLVALAVLGCGRVRAPVVTLAEYQRVQLRMSYVQVVAIVGAPGRLLARNYTPNIRGDLPDEPLHAYVWANPEGSSMVGVFRERELVEKLQSGLK